jgi:hypothetical protein
MALGSTQHLTGVSTTNLPGSNGWPAYEAGDHAAVSEPIVLKIWEPRCLTTLRTSTACYTDGFMYKQINHHER